MPMKAITHTRLKAASRIDFDISIPKISVLIIDEKITSPIMTISVSRWTFLKNLLIRMTAIENRRG